MRRVRSIGLVAVFDVSDSLRSKKAIALLLLYLIGALGGSALFVRALSAIEHQLGAAAGMARGMAQSEQFVKLAGGLVGHSMARTLLEMPPLALFYGWLALTFIPLIVVLSSSDAITHEVASGSARFALQRVDRLSWTLGKLLGQSSLMVVGIAIGALATMIVGAVGYDGFEPFKTLWWIVRLSGRACVQGFAYLGLALCASQLTRSVAGARGLAIGMLIACSALGNLFGASFVVDRLPTLAPVAHKLFPAAYSLDLWRPELAPRLTAMAALVAFGFVLFGLGYLRFSRRDA